MKTNRTFVFTLIVIALFTMLLSACSPAEMVKAGSDLAGSQVGNAPAYGINVNLSPRISECNMSSNQLILNVANAQTDTQAEATTVDAFLDGLMPTYQCIAPKPESK